MASISTPTFPYARHTPDQTHHKLTHASKFTSTRLNRSSYSSTVFPHSLSRVSDSSAICRCQNNKDLDNNNDNGASSRRWDSVLQENFRNAMKWLDEYRNGHRNQSKEEDKDSDSVSDGVVKSEGEMDGDRDYEWDWERWKKHFSEIDEQERVVSILKTQLNRAILKEDYEDAARIKVAIAAASASDTVGRAMSYLNKAIEEERYRDAAFVRDHAGAGLVGWWAGLSDDSNDPYGRIIHISAEHGRYLARSYTPRQLSMSTDGAPLFEIFLTVNKKGEYRHRAVYLKQSEVPHDFSIDSIKPSQLSTSMISVVGENGDLFATDTDDMDDSEDREDDFDMPEGSFLDNFRDIISSAKDPKLKADVTTPARIDMDLISKEVEHGIEEDDEDDEDNEDDEDDDSEAESTEVELELDDETDEELNITDVDANDRMVDIGGMNQSSVMVVVGGPVRKTSNSTSREDLVRIPANLDKKGRSSFSFYIEKEQKQVSPTNPKSQSPKNREMRSGDDLSIDSVFHVLAKSMGSGKISMKVLKDLSRLLRISLNQAQARNPLSGSTTFNRIELPATADPLNGLYVGAHGLYTSEVIRLRRKFGQWEENISTKEVTNLEFYEYVEAVKITGDPCVPAGQVAFRAKVGTKYQLPSKGIIPEEFGVIARYRGQGKLAEPGFQNPRWVDGELVILDGKCPVVAFVYRAPENHFLVVFNQLRLQD